MTESAKVYPAIVRVTEQLAKVGVGKKQKNQQQGYSFRGVDDVRNALAPILAEAKLCILPRVISRKVVERTTTKGATLFYVTVEVHFDFVSAEDGSRHTIITIGEAMDSGDKATNKAMSAAYKYAAFLAFSIPTEGTPDADGATHEVLPDFDDAPWLEAIDAADAETLSELATKLASTPMPVKSRNVLRKAWADKKRALQ